MPPIYDRLTVKLPPGTRARLLALAQPNEPLTQTLLRAIAALEGVSGPENTDLAARVAALEAWRASCDAPRRQPDAPSDAPRRHVTPRPADYPVEVWQMAIRLKDEGAPLVEIARAMQQATGRARPPNAGNLGSRIKQWRIKLGMP
jgi:hypothetical protein